MNQLNGRYSQILEQLSAHEKQYERATNSVKLLAVSKRKPIEDIQSLYQLGQRDFGENYLQEALTKISSIAEKNIVWHFIGPIQSNKTTQIAENFHWVHSIDRLKIAQRLSNSRPDDLPPLNVCIQVNISEEESKSGISADELDELVAAVSELKNLQLRGLMTLPLPSKEFSVQYEQCKELSTLLVQLNKQGYEMDTLSMGTSQDLEAAIAAGSTMVRIGTAVFGPRD